MSGLPPAPLEKWFAVLFPAMAAVSYGAIEYLPTIVNLGMRLPETPVNRVVMLTVAMGSSLLASSLFYRFIELPSQRRSSALPYTPAKRTPALTRMRM